MNVLAIDQGTSATKALLVCEGRGVLAEAEVPIHPAATPDGGVEQDPGELWASVLEAGSRVLAEAGEPAHAIGLANQGETVLAWDPASGVPCSAAISWQDRRAAGVCERLAGKAEELQAITGLPLDPYFSAPKIIWLRDHVTADGVVTTTDAWLLHQLTGRTATDAATASRTLLLELDRVAWSDRACKLFGVDPASLPEVVPCAGPLGEARAFGGQVPVAGAVVDQQAALFAEGCLAPGEAKCTYGTGAFLLATAGGTPRRSRTGLVSCVAWLIGDTTTYCLDGQVFAAGSAVSWLSGVGLIASPADLDGLGGQVRAPEGVIFVPGLAGLGAPFWRPRARGAFLGLSLGTTRAHLVRSFIEGVTAAVTWLARAVAVDLGAPLARLRADGGLTRSRLLMQAQADLLQAPVEVYPSPNATALGVAALTRLGMGWVSGPTQAVLGWEPMAVYEPTISASEAEARLGAWRAAAEATMDLPA